MPPRIVLVLPLNRVDTNSNESLNAAIQPGWVWPDELPVGHPEPLRKGPEYLVSISRPRIPTDDHLRGM